jgi:hypothetical protein
MRRHPIFIASAFLGVVAAVALGMLLSGDEGPERSAADVGGRPPLEPVWHGLRKKGDSESAPADSLRAAQEAFQIMRGAPEAVPARVQRHIRETIGASPDEFQFENTQFTPVNGGLWIVSGENVTCVSQRGIGGFACDTTTRFAKNGAVVGVGIGARGSPGRPREFLVQGAAPDWARIARMEVDRRVRLVEIENNTYALRAKARVLLDRLER